MKRIHPKSRCRKITIRTTEGTMEGTMEVCAWTFGLWGVNRDPSDRTWQVTHIPTGYSVVCESEWVEYEIVRYQPLTFQEAKERAIQLQLIAPIRCGWNDPVPMTWKPFIDKVVRENTQTFRKVEISSPIRKIRRRI